MKNLKKPTYDQKRKIAKKGMDWHEWLVKKDGVMLVIVNKKSGEEKSI